MNGFRILHAFVHWSRRAEILKKTIGIAWFHTFAAFLPWCRRSESAQFSIANIDVRARDLLFRLGETRASVTKYRFFLIKNMLYFPLTSPWLPGGANPSMRIILYFKGITGEQAPGTHLHHALLQFGSPPNAGLLGLRRVSRNIRLLFVEKKCLRQRTHKLGASRNVEFFCGKKRLRQRTHKLGASRNT